MIQGAHLPLIHLLLLGKQLLREAFLHVFQTVQIRLERRQCVLYFHLDEHTVDHTKALAVTVKGLQSVQHGSRSLTSANRTVVDGDLND